MQIMKLQSCRAHALRAFAISCSLMIAGCATWPTSNDDGKGLEQADKAEQVEQNTSARAYSRSDQSPGFFRMRLGTYLVTALYDGSFEINSKLMKGRSQADIIRLLRLSKQPKDVRTSVNAFLLDDGERVILVDTGASQALGASMGKLESSLQMSGYKPENVTYVLLTHLHPDHDGVLVSDGKMAFPNAQVYLPRAEAAFWLEGDRNKDNLPVYQGQQLSLAPYQKAGRLHTFESGKDPIAGVQSILMSGHTPGHTGYRIRSENESILVWGDIVHSVATQFSDPTITLEFDVEQSKARSTRNKVLRDAATSGEWIAGSHLPFPGIGRVQAEGKTSYRWLPVDYSQAMTASEKRQPVVGK